MTITVKQAKDALDVAGFAYLSADIEHSVAVFVAKEALTEARYEYLHACAALCEKIGFISDLDHLEAELANQGIWK